MSPHTTMTESRLESELAQRGVRMTRQRRAILATIESAERHLDAAQILRRASRVEASVNRVTVYRTIGLLKRYGLIDELDLMHVTGDAHFYERRPEHDHIHVTCLRCGQVIEFESEHLAQLRAEVEQQCGFRVDVARTEIGGYCGGCQAMPEATAATRATRANKKGAEDAHACGDAAHIA
jgi:Fur family ferric uptake transcriptional regulator